MTYILFVPDSLCNKFISYLLLGNPSVNPMVNVQNVSHREYVTGVCQESNPSLEIVGLDIEYVD